MKVLSILFRGRNYKNVNGRNLQTLLKKNKGMVLIDVRNPLEYNSGHIPGAINIPLDNILNKINYLSSYKNTGVIVYCQGGARSAQAARILSSNGFNNIYNLSGGISAYKSNLTIK